MKILLPALIALAAAPMTLVPVSPAVAQTAADCQAQIASLKTETSALTITGKNADKELAGLVRILDAASTELGKGKNADAATKLSDFKVKVQNLAGAGRISGDSASSLTGKADSAIACINGLSAG